MLLPSRLPAANSDNNAMPLTLAAGCDETVVGHCVGRAAVPLHLIKELQRSLPAPRLLASTDKAAECDHTAAVNIDATAKAWSAMT